MMMAIHVSKSTRPWHMNLGHEEPFWSALEPFHTPTGGLRCYNGNIIAYGNLIDCIEIPEPVNGEITLQGEIVYDFVYVGSNEYQFGDYTPGRFAWIFGDMKMLPEPIPAKGRLGIWEHEIPEVATE
jgi:hypothetical protein